MNKEAYDSSGDEAEDEAYIKKKLLEYDFDKE